MLDLLMRGRLAWEKEWDYLSVVIIAGLNVPAACAPTQGGRSYLPST